MIRSYSPEQVAAVHLPEEWKDRVRWLKRRLATGEIPGKRISRGVYRMTDEDVEAWLQARNAANTAPQAETVQTEATVSVIDGLSSRTRARKRASA